jgi:phosphatidylglycerol:prolipoprotein diacylglycerol transferase
MHPILFQIPTPWGAAAVYSYGVMLGLSLLVAWVLILQVGWRKERLEKERTGTGVLVTALAGLVGARLLYVATNPGMFDSLGGALAFRSGGLVAYGGFAGGFVASWAYMRWRGVPLMAWGDVVAPALGSGLFLTRIGCWLYGCDFGKPLGKGAPGWLAELGTFPKWSLPAEKGPALACDATLRGSQAWLWHRQQYDLPADATTSLAVHPTQLYAAAFGLVLLALAFAIWRVRRFRGQVLLSVAAAYAVWRFGIEYLRDDPGRGSALGLSTSQWCSMLLLPVVIASYVVLRKRWNTGREGPAPQD